VLTGRGPRSGEHRRMTIRIGIAGWRYAPWRGVFYPRALPQRQELEYAARLFPTIEINGSFYSLQTPKSWQAWHDATLEHCVFAVKGPRYITHILRLRDIDTALANFYASGVLLLRDKLGPMLWQFPPFFRYDRARFAAFFERLPRTVPEAIAIAERHDRDRMHGRRAWPDMPDEGRSSTQRLRHAVEIRHASFITADFIDLLRAHDIGLVVPIAASAVTGREARLYNESASE
jgi:uncharacterized protein YecE (DUF72 family)